MNCAISIRLIDRCFLSSCRSGFHDAIGDAVTLSLTPKHLQSLGLIQKSIDDTAHDVNFLFAMAMDKVSDNFSSRPRRESESKPKTSITFLLQVVFLPYALALEQWRYDVFSKKIRKDQYNCHWWRLR